jgi:hypothetical protein
MLPEALGRRTGAHRPTRRREASVASDKPRAEVEVGDYEKFLY